MSNPKVLSAAAVVVMLFVVCFGVLVQQYNAWAYADLERNVEEFNHTSTLDSCMDEIDGVWLPWLRAEAHDMCSEVTGTG